MAIFNGDNYSRHPRLNRVASAFEAVDPEALPPQHIEAEMSVLGAMLRDNAVIDTVLEILRPEDFYRDIHQIICRRAAHLHSAGTAIDCVTLVDDLEALGLLEEIGGVDYLAELIQCVPHSANASFHAHIVKKMSKARLAIERAEEVIRRAYNRHEMADDVLDAAVRMIEEIRADPTDDGSMELNPLPTKMDAAAFRGILAEIVGRIAPETEASPEAILGQFLVAFGNLCGRKPNWRINATVHRANLFLCIVGPTGSGRKGTSWDVTRWLLARADPDWADCPVLSGLTSGEGLIQHCKDAKGPVLAVESEFGRLLAGASRDNNTLTQVLRQAFDGADLNVPTRKDSLHVSDAHVSVIGHITYSELKSKITQCDIENGLVNRFLWLHTYRARLLPDGGDFQELTRALGPMVQGVSFAIEFARQDVDFAIPFLRDAAAKEMWRAIYEPLTDTLPGHYGNAVERRAPLVMRLAMLYSILDRDLYIRPEHLESAMAVWDYCDRTAAHIFGAPKTDKNLRRLMELLDGAPEGLTRTQISRKVFSGRAPASELDALIQATYATGKYVYKEEKTGGAKRHVLLHMKYGDASKSAK